MLNQPAPDFSLYGLDGKLYQLEQQRGWIVVLVFWSAECPWSEQADQEIWTSFETWDARVVWWSIAANANESLDLLQVIAAERRLPVVLHDTYQEATNLYGAETTPHAFVIDSQGVLRYRGAVNDRSFRQRTATRHYLRLAVEDLLAGVLPEPAETHPYGCAIVRFG